MQLRSLAVTLAAIAALAACGDGNDRPAPTPTPGTTAARSITPFPTTTPAATPTSTPSTFPIVSGLDSTTALDAAWGDRGYLVTFGDRGSRTSPDVFGIRLTPDGEVDGGRFLLSDFGGSPFLGPDGSYSPQAIASSASEFGVFLFGRGDVPAGAPGQIVGFARVPFGGPPLLPATDRRRALPRGLRPRRRRCGVRRRGDVRRARLTRTVQPDRGVRGERARAVIDGSA